MSDTVFSAFINGAPVVYTVDQLKDVLGTSELERKLSAANTVSPDALAAVVDVHNAVAREQYAAFSQSLDDILAGNGPDQEAAQAARDAAIAARDVANVAAGNAETARDESQAARDAAALARDASQGAAGQSQTASDQSQAASAASVAANVKAQAAALAAADRVADAGGFAQTASGQATIATQQATAAGQAATSATSSADIATTKAGEAVASASRAVTSENNAAGSQVAAAQSQGISATSAGAADLSAAAAAQATLAGLPQTFDPRWWMDGVVYGANPSTYPNATGLVPLGAGYQLDGSKNTISSKFIIPVTAGNTYECTIEYEPAADTANTGASAGRFFLNRRDARGVYLGGQPGVVWDFTRGTKLTFRYVPTAGTLTVNALITLDVAGSTSAVKTLFKKFTVVDVTARDAAAASASASAGSADLASVKANEAGQSATSASASSNAAKTAQGSAEAARDQAAQSKTDASGSASSAVGSASVAADAATKAGQSASGASTSEQNAAASANAAGQKASAATDSANVATTKAGEARTSATAAATSESNAAGSANTASQSAGLATQAKTDAAGFAAASAGSASAASSKADEAGQSATAASQAKLDAVAARDNSLASAGVSQQQAAIATDRAAAASASADLSAQRATDAGVALAGINDASGVIATTLSATAQQVKTLSASIGGYNVLSNTEFVTTDGWSNSIQGAAVLSFGIDAAGDLYHPPGEHVLSIAQAAPAGGGAYSDWQGQRFPVLASRSYQFYVFVNSHRCDVDAYFVWFNASGQFIDATPSQRARGPGGSSNTEDGFTRIGLISVKPPAGTVSGALWLRKYDTDAGQTSSYAWFWRPYMAEARDGQTGWAPFTAGTGAALLQQTAIATADLYGRTSSRLTLAAITPGGRAQFNLFSDSVIGAGWELIGDGRITGNVVVDGTITSTKFDTTSMSQLGGAAWSGQVNGTPGGANVPWSVTLSPIQPRGRFLFEAQMQIVTNANQTTVTANYQNTGKQLRVRYDPDSAGVFVRATDNQGNIYSVGSAAFQTASVVATTPFTATFVATVYTGGRDSGVIDQGDYFERVISASYSLLAISLRVTWLAL